MKHGFDNLETHEFAYDAFDMYKVIASRNVSMGDDSAIKADKLSIVVKAL